MKTIYASEVLKPRIQVTTPKRNIDKPLSRLVNRDVVVGTAPHRKAVHLINQWNMARAENDYRSIDYLKDEKKVKQLKEVLR